MKLPQSRQIYRHYKKKLYKVITVSRSTDDPKHSFVIYQSQYTDKVYGKNCVWSRKLKELQDDVTVNGNVVKRFTLEEVNMFKRRKINESLLKTSLFSVPIICFFLCMNSQVK